MSTPRLDPRALPELHDVRAWLAATEPRQRDVLQAVAAAMGPDYEVVYGDPDPRARGSATDAAAFEHASLQGGFRIEHGPSGLLMAFVPGGVTQVGLSDQELALLDDPELVDSTIAPDPADVAFVHAHAPFMRGAQGQARVVAVAPFLMAEAPLTIERCTTLGMAPPPPKDGDVERLGQVDARALAALPAPLRLPSEIEWEHASRAGSRSPFAFGDFPPRALGDPLHPLGLAALGHFAEATSDPWRRHLDAGVAWPVAEGPSPLGVVRGGAAACLPWRPGGGGWARLLSAWRATWFKDRERVVVRPVIGVPCDAPELAQPPRRTPPSYRLARRTSDLLGRLFVPDADLREEARAELRRTIAGFGIWTGQAVAALPWLVDLTTQPFVPERHRLIALVADLVAGDHAATIATGLDRTLPFLAEIAAHNAPRALRQALFERMGKLLALASDIEAPIRAAVPLATTMLPEAEALARGALEAALVNETVPEVEASLLLGLGRLDRYARRAPRTEPFDDAHPLVAGVARLAAVMADPKALAPHEDEADPNGVIGVEHQAALLALLRVTTDVDHFPWHGARLGPLVARVLTDCLPDGGIHAGLLLARAVREAGLDDDARVATWAEGAIRVGLGGAMRKHVEALDQRQWQIVADVSRRDFPALAPAWRAVGLPPDMGQRRTLVVRHRGRL